MKTAVVSICSPEYRALGDITGARWATYCERWGYDNLTLQPPSGARGLAWQKITMLRDLIDSYDLVLWAGCDVLLTNSDLSIVGEWEGHGSPAALLSADVYGINSDVMLFRRCPEVEMFLSAVDTHGWWLYRDHPWHEQQAIIDLAGHPPYSQIVKVIPQKGFNSYLHAEYGRPTTWPGNWQAGDWMLHLPSLPMARRIELATKYSSLTSA